MRPIVALALAASLVGVAAAQDDAPLVFTPSWEAEPSFAEIVRHYPQQALAQNVSGIAVMCCTPRPDRSIDCAVSSEWPEGREFGAAAVRASLGYRLTPDSYNDLHVRNDTPVRLSMLWAAPVLSNETRERLVQIDRETAYACLPPADAGSTN